VKKIVIFCSWAAVKDAVKTNANATITVLNSEFIWFIVTNPIGNFVPI
jgi:hypothetical protein